MFYLNKNLNGFTFLTLPTIQFHEDKVSNSQVVTWTQWADGRIEQ